MPDIFNIIAAICSYIIQNAQEDRLFIHYSCISKQDARHLQQEIAQQLPTLFEQDNSTAESPEAVRQLTEVDLNDDFCQTLEQYAALLKKKQRLFSLLKLVQLLDEGLRSLLQEKIAKFQSESFSVVLNTNRETTGVGLLPRCSCIWERKHRLSHSYNRLDNFLSNLLLLENSILGDLIDKHFFLSSELFPRLNKERRIRVAASPLRLEKDFAVETYTKNQVAYFRINSSQSDDIKNNELIWQKILSAGKQLADIIVFPEMLGNANTEAFIIQRLRRCSREQQQHIPSLIILPSVWRRQLNTTSVLDNKGNLLCRQSKQNPFRMEDGQQGYLEGILSNKVVNIFHYQGLGRIAVLICKDFLTTRYMEQLMRCFKLTLIIVPSFSTGSYDFRQSFDLCAHDDCNVVWINTCAALQKGKEANFEHIGYVRKRVGRNDDDSQRLCKMPICPLAFFGNCSHDCLYYETIQEV